MYQRGSILVGLLWCLALLSVAVISLLHSARLDLKIVKNHGDRIQARYLALAGVEKAKAVLYHDMIERRGTALSHSTAAYDNPLAFRDVQFGRGAYRVARLDADTGDLIYGVIDESSLLNVNTATAEDLSKIEGMTPDIIAAIIDWRDEDNAASPNGAEQEYYASLLPPTRPRNAPLQTLRELLMVRGVTREALLGLEEESPWPNADETERAAPLENLEIPWARLLTVHSISDNLRASGEARVNLQSADEAALTALKGVNSATAKAIIARRGQKQFESIASLLDEAPAQNAQPNRPGRPPSNDSAGDAGRRLMGEDLFIEIADDITIENDLSQPGLININTAGVEVLRCLPGVERELASAIVSHRTSSGPFANIGGLLKVPGMTRDLFKVLAPRLSARADTFRIVSEGRVTSTGARQKIETIVHVERYSIETLAYRELP